MKYFVFSFLLFVAVLTRAQESTHSPIYFIYDASGSMWGQMEDQTKMAIAADVLTQTVGSLPDNQKMGLIVYGHRNEGDCKDVEFLVDAREGNKSNMEDAVKQIKPLGRTPLAYSALQVINHLRTTSEKATIILITDGIESCGGNICDVVKSAKAEGIDFKLHIIGFGLKDENTDQLTCAAEEGEGQYYLAEDSKELMTGLNAALSKPVDEPNPNFSVYAEKDAKAIDAWVKAIPEDHDGKSFAVRTYQDTGYIYLPPGTYRLEVAPLSGSDMKSISLSDVKIVPDKMNHETISFSGGTLKVETTNNGQNWDCIVKLLDPSGKVVAYVRTYSTVKEAEVNPGTYSATIQALAMKGEQTYATIEDIVIKANQSTPLTYAFESGEFQISTKVGNENIDCIVTVFDVKTGKNIVGKRTYTKGAHLLLTPGTYEAKVVPLGEHKDKTKQVIQFEIKPNEQTARSLSF